MTTREKQIRLEAGLSLTAAAAMAGVAPHTWKTYELARDALTEPKRRDCDAGLSRMAEIARKKSAA